jgi:GTP-binding protein YchF
VLRCFENENVTHVDGSVDPVRDKEVIDIELQLKDFESLQKLLDKTSKAARVGDKSMKKEADFYDRLKTFMESGASARSFPIEGDDEIMWMKQAQLLTSKPVLYVCNVDEASAKNGNDYVKRVIEAVADEHAEVIVLAAATEADISELESFEERQMFLDDLGLEEPGVNVLVRAAYKLLDLHTYFTAGEKEVRAWTIPAGSTAPQAAGVIHSDFEKGFIRAEVIAYDDYAHYGSESAAREAGKLRVEGKEYIVKDGDVMHFRFNV